MYKYDFAVVMAVYNTEPFLKEAIDSLICQTIGFSHIQLILVDDGSTDGSGKVCDDYKNCFPENIIVIHKENGGVSSARNAGIPFAEGKYLNFMDSDDRMAQDAFEKVFAFFEKHSEETDVVAIPVRFFDGQSGEHIQNHKFSIDEDIVNLYEHPYIINLSCSYSFFKSESTRGTAFDSALINSEDAKFVLLVLLKKMRLGMVGDTTYWYRKRSSGEASAVESQTKKTCNYVQWLEHFANWALDYVRDQFGQIPKFVQYEVMYNFQWKLLQHHIPIDVLSVDEQARYRNMLKSTIRRIDVDVIMAQRNITEPYKVYAIMQKNGKDLDLRKVENDIELLYDQKVVASISKMDTVLEFLTFDETNNSYTIEGYHLLYGVENEVFEPYLIVNGQPVRCDLVKRINEEYVFCGEDIVKMIGFKAVVMADEAKITIRPAVKLRGMIVERTVCRYGLFFPVSDTYEYGYAHLGQYTATVHEREIVLVKRGGAINDIIREMNFLCEVWKKNKGNARRGFVLRLLYQMARMFKRRKLWMVSDRVNRADDNGEAFYQFLLTHKPPRTRVVFAIGKNSQDYERLIKRGECVAIPSLRFKIMFMLCDVNISSHADKKDFYTHIEELRNVFAHTKYVFLQHGITKHDMSGYLNRYKQNISGFVTASFSEFDSVKAESYGYKQGQIWLTGLPRYDRLYHAEKKYITIMPTWRKYLMQFTNEPGLNGCEPKKDFEQQDYFRFYDSLINSDRLINALQEIGYTLQFFPHPIVNPFMERFHHDSRVVFLSTFETNYRDVYAMSELVVTDYSSAVFDFAYLRKPLVYCQFDKEKFYSGEQLYSKGYFDDERDGFGEVVYDLDQAIDLIIEYARGGCVLKEKYRQRIESFFAFSDQNNCQRVLDKIQALNIIQD